MDRIDTIQIYGERASGTNFLEHLLRQNLNFIKFTDSFGWKHGFPATGVEDATNCLFVVIYRHPYDWIRSLHNMPWHSAPVLRCLDFSSFIRSEWWCIRDEHAFLKPGDPAYGEEMMEERSPETGERFPNILKVRSSKIFHWEALKQRAPHSFHIRYEDLNRDPASILAEMSRDFSLNKKRLLREIRGDKGGDRPFMKKTYNPLSPRDEEFILRQLDLDLEKSIGYDLT
jgi:hypothetical protein